MVIANKLMSWKQKWVGNTVDSRNSDLALQLSWEIATSLINKVQSETIGNYDVTVELSKSSNKSLLQTNRNFIWNMEQSSNNPSRPDPVLSGSEKSCVDPTRNTLRRGVTEQKEKRGLFPSAFPFARRIPVRLDAIRLTFAGQRKKGTTWKLR